MDKKALLNELKIDRDDASGGRKPLKWLVAIAVVGGIAFVGWAFGRPYLAGTDAAAAEVRTLLVRTSSAATPGGSVLDATGYVVARRQATVSAKTTGKVMEVLIEEGMTVEEGQLLAVLDASIPEARLALFESQLASARALVDEIGVDIRQAALDYSRTKDLAERDLASQAELDRARLVLQGLQARLKRTERDIEVAGRSLAVQRREVDDMQIRAPFGGVVIAKAAQPGEMISPISAGGGFTRTGICTIVDMDSLEVEVDVNEAYINRVYPDQPVTVTLNAYPDFPIPAAVIATIPAADRNKATVRVRIAFRDRDPRVLPDMGVRVAFLEEGEPTEERATAKILVPRAAVASAEGARYVWVVSDLGDGRGTVARRTVVVGRSEGSRIQVTAGLSDGERIVAAALEPTLRDGDEINLIN
ncbi:MAG: efflux RND transporter periplasmic adaptor subunit [Gammaproteobacteria bacterium]|nr:efflux RND transporter periplasmic adaptor subunit [Gammaproteobacteria bacterium]